MLIGGILLGLILGLLAGGSILNLAKVQLRWISVLLLAVILRFGTEFFLVRGVAIVEALRLPLFAIAFGLLLVGLWVNRAQPGLRLAFVGILLNTTAIIANGGYMPIWEPSLLAAGFQTSDLTAFHVLLTDGLSADFLIHAGPLADILPVPLPLIQNVLSIGDVFLTAGLAFFLFASVVRPAGETDEDWVPGDQPLTGLASASRLPRSVASAIGGQRVRPGTGLAPGLAETAALEHPLLLGTPGTGMAGPSAGGAGRAGRAEYRGLDSIGGRSPFDRGGAGAGAGAGRGPGAGGGAAAATTTASFGARPVALAPVPAAGTVPIDGAIGAPARPRTDVTVRVRQHPYTRLALNGSFSALWTGQLISLFGDRVHQVALTFLVAAVTDSPLAVAFVFVAATLPNLLLSPVAGAYVDRWNQRDVMIVSDLLRAASVLMIPIVATTNIYLVYPLIFAITSISIFFRPARVAVLPRLVRDDELLTANSAMWAGETFADIIGYPLAGIFVAFLGASIPLAFWFDAATYAASAVLIASIAVPPVVRRARSAPGAAATREDQEEPRTSVLEDMRQGFRFLRSERVLFFNTIQAAFAQFAIGALTALTPIFVRDVLAPPNVDPKAAYAFLETAIGIGNLIGGFAIGLVGARMAKGRSIIAGYVFWGVTMILFALGGNLLLDFGILIGAGIANMVFVIPSQVLFQERTPPDMIGRVVGFRFALVFGSMTLAMAVGGLAATVIGTVAVLVISGVVSIVAGLAGLLVPEMRDA